MLLISGFLVWLVVKNCPAGLRNMVTLAASELSFPLRVDREIYLAKKTKKIFKRSQDLGSNTKNCSKISNSLNNKPKSGSHMETLQLSCQHLKRNSWKSPNDSSP